MNLLEKRREISNILLMLQGRMPYFCTTVMDIQKRLAHKHVICKENILIKIFGSIFFCVSYSSCKKMPVFLFLFYFYCRMMSSMAKSFRETNLKFSSHVLDLRDNTTEARKVDLEREAGTKHASK